MKKLTAILLLLCMLVPLAAAASADSPQTAVHGVSVAATGCSSTPGADGAPRLTVFLDVENKSDGPRTLRADSCLIGPCELPANLSCALEAGERAEAMLTVPLTPLSYFDLSGFPTDLLRLRLAASAPGEEERPGEWLPLRISALPPIPEKERGGAELFRRFGARVTTLGGNWDGRVLTAWFLLENNNDFPLLLTGGLTGAEASPLCGGSVRGHSSAAFRVDVPADIRPVARIFTLNCALSGCADGEDKAPVPMASFEAAFHTREARPGMWTIIPDGDCEYENDQQYIARVGLRDFRYDECLPGPQAETGTAPLPKRESGLVSIACCGAYEVLAGPEAQNGTLLRLPLTLRSFTGEALSLRIAPPQEGLALPCLTASTLICPANGSASADYLFEAAGLAFTGHAGETSLSHGFTLLIGPESDAERLYGVYPAERFCTLAEAIKPAGESHFEEIALDGLTLRLLGLDVSDGLSLWLEAKNAGISALPFGSQKMEAMLNSTVIELVNSSPEIPAGTDTLVFLRGAVFDKDGAADPVAFQMPPLTELNTLKLKLAEGTTLTLMFRQNGDVMFANVA